MKNCFCNLKNYIALHGNYFGFNLVYMLLSLPLLKYLDSIGCLYPAVSWSWLGFYFIGDCFADRLDYIENRLKEIASENGIFK